MYKVDAKTRIIEKKEQQRTLDDTKFTCPNAALQSKHEKISFFLLRELKIKAFKDI